MRSSRPRPEAVGRRQLLLASAAAAAGSAGLLSARADAAGLGDDVVALLREGRALALLSQGQIAPHGGLAAVQGGPALPRRVVGVTQRARWWPTPAQQAFLDALFAAGLAQAARGSGAR